MSTMTPRAVVGQTSIAIIAASRLPATVIEFKRMKTRMWIWKTMRRRSIGTLKGVRARKKRMKGRRRWTTTE